MLSCHLSPVKLKALPGISLTPFSFTLSTVPRLMLVKVTEPQQPVGKTTFGSEMELPLASHTLNFTGMVLPALRLYTLEPSALIGGKITAPGSDPVQVPKPIVRVPLRKYVPGSGPG